MRKPIPNRRTRNRRATAWLFCCAVLFSLGCPTATETGNIVANTNALLLNPLRTPSESVEGGDWQAELARIDAFIENNADQPALANALRLRQAMLVTVYRQDSLALAIFDLIDPNRLGVRDRALYDVHEPMVWWFKLGGGRLSSAGLEKATAALATFDEVNDALAPESEIRAYLEEMRAWIAVGAAAAQPTGEEGKAEARRLLTAGMDRFAAIVPPSDVAWIKDHPSAAGERLKEVPRALRLRLRAPVVVREYRRVAAIKGLAEWGEPARTLLAAVDADG